MQDRAPYVLDLITTVATSTLKKKKENQVPPIFSICCSQLNLITVMLGKWALSITSDCAFV